jgi:dynein heavy chain, axonemal
VLDEAKITGDDIKVRLAEAAITEKEIDKSRESFRPIAFRTQTLFFTICELAVIDPMYQYSLQWFANLFSNSIEHSAKAPNDAAQRILNLNNAFTLNLYENICRSLFERHKMLFSFAMTIKILQGFDKIDPLELRFFLSGPSGDIKVPPNPTEWLTDLDWIEAYKNMYCASQLDSF